MVAKTRGSNCYLEFISNSNVKDNLTFWRRNLSIIFFRTFRTNTNRTDPQFCSCSSRTELLRTVARSVRAEHEQNRGSVRFGSFRTMPVFGSRSNRTNRTNSNLHCSASHLCNEAKLRVVCKASGFKTDC